MLLSPVVLVVLLTFVIDMALAPADRGGVFYREVRISRGRRFDLLKFRTLRTKVLARAAGHAGPHELDATNLTWIGRRVLKPWYLDEVPQFLNVLRGEISPQVTKGLGKSYAELDEEYVARCVSLGGWALARYDLGILAQTLKVMARGEGLSY